MKTVLILGDCQSNGNNCLAHQIIADQKFATWSMKFHKQFVEVFRWYVNHKKQHGVTEELPSGNLQSAVWNYFWNEELKVAWPNLIKSFNVVNISINGGHFTGHLKRYKNYISNNPVPDHVIITDYAGSHLAHSFKWAGKQYVFERENYTNEEWNPSRYPQEVHNKRINMLAYMKQQSKEWHIKRHRRGFNALTQAIRSTDVPYSVVRFGDCDEYNTLAFDSFMGREVDCIPFANQYLTEAGEDSKIKYDLQPQIAAFVESAIVRKL